MDQLLISLFYLLRPALFVELDMQWLGLGFFDIATMGITGLLGASAFVSSSRGHSLPFSSVEYWIIAFVLWCTAVLVIYWDVSDSRTYAKWIIAPLTYVFLRRIVSNPRDFHRCLLFLVAGFSLPVFGSAWLTFIGQGIDMEVYSTGVSRYRGVYANIHNMGHSMALVLMLMTIYLVISRPRNIRTATNSVSGTPAWWAIAGSVCLGAAALYCLFNAQVRTAYVGLFLFVVVLLFCYSKKALAGFVITCMAFALVFSSALRIVFYDVDEAVRGERSLDRAGSGRPAIWSHNLRLFGDLTLDRKIAGVGIGNTGIGASAKGLLKDRQGAWNSHNDFLETLMQTGALGLCLLVGIYYSMWRAVIRMNGRGRGAFLALFVTVMAMNFLSNSYVSRFGLAQIFFMIMVYVEMPQAVRHSLVRQGRLRLSAAALGESYLGSK